MNSGEQTRITRIVQLPIVVSRMVFALASQTCMRSWATIDDGFARGFPTDLVYFSEEKDVIHLHVPSVDLVFSRT
jgi:hypothetical protein